VIVRMTLAQFERWRAALPRGPLGVIWPGGGPPVVLIVEEPRPVIPAALVRAATGYAALGRS
jgi:hypothetical protein